MVTENPRNLLSNCSTAFQAEFSLKFQNKGKHKGKEGRIERMNRIKPYFIMGFKNTIDLRVI